MWASFCFKFSSFVFKNVYTIDLGSGGVPSMMESLVGMKAESLVETFINMHE